MRFMNKILNFFASNYNNNIKYHSSTLSYLKIFFERNNKFKSTFSSLGNVFRNSKWSDLKIQNIKTSFIKSWSSYALLIVTFILLFFMLGSYTGHEWLSYLPFAGEVYEISAYFWAQLEDLVKSWVVSLFMIFQSTKLILATFFRPKTNHILESIAVKKETIPSNTKVQLKKKRSFTGTGYRTNPNSQWSETAMLDLVRTTKSINNLDYWPQSTSSTIRDNNLVTLVNSLQHSTATANQSLNIITGIEKNYSLLVNSNVKLKQYSINSQQLSLLTNNNLSLSLLGGNADQIIKNAKEDRWLLKNSLLSENLIINSNAFTQSKKLLGLNVLSSDSTSKNVWTSSKFNLLDKESSSSFLSSIQGLFTSDVSKSLLLNQNNFNPQLSNYDSFETSRMWLAKKYYYTNQLKNNTSSLFLNYNKTNPGYVNNNTYYLLIDAYNRDLLKQLDTLVCYNNSLNIVDKLSTQGSTKIILTNPDKDILRALNLSFINNVTNNLNTGTLNYYTPSTSIILDNPNVKLTYLK